MTLIAALIIAYLIGSIPFAVVVSKLMGLQDPRSFGSGNPGATNVLRTGNKLAALLTLIGDAGKGWFAVWLASHFAAEYGWGITELAMIGVAAFLGHVFSVWLKFQGGKGVATAAGVLLALSWKLGVAVLIVWLTMAVVFRYSSLAALTAAIAAPILGYILKFPAAVLIALMVMSGVLIMRHAANIRKLLAGQESKLGAKKKPAEPAH